LKRLAKFAAMRSVALTTSGIDEGDKQCGDQRCERNVTWDRS
jgi:hypothetical protein